MSHSIDITYPEGTNNQVLVELVATETVKFVTHQITHPTNSNDPILVECFYESVSGNGEETGTTFTVPVNAETGDTIRFEFKIGSASTTSLEHPFPNLGGRFNHRFS